MTLILRSAGMLSDYLLDSMYLADLPIRKNIAAMTANSTTSPFNIRTKL